MSNFQSMAVEQGADFHNECLKALKYAGFILVETEMHLEDVGITLDAVTNNQKGVHMAWEFKGSLQGKRPSLVRTDTVKKAIANAWLLSVSARYAEFFPPLFLMRSHEPDRGDARRMLDVALRTGLLAGVVDSRDGEFLSWLVKATQDDITGLVAKRQRTSLGLATRDINAVPKQHMRVSKDRAVPGTASRRQLATAAQLDIQFGA